MVMFVSPAKKRLADQNGDWKVDSGGPKEPCIRWGLRSPYFLYCGQPTSGP